MKDLLAGMSDQLAGIIIGLCVFGVMCFIGFICYIFKWRHNTIRKDHKHNNDKSEDDPLYYRQ